MQAGLQVPYCCQPVTYVNMFSTNHRGAGGGVLVLTWSGDHLLPDGTIHTFSYYTFRQNKQQGCTITDTCYHRYVHIIIDTYGMAHLVTFIHSDTYYHAHP
jgi:hypothetical protein